MIKKIIFTVIFAFACNYSTASDNFKHGISIFGDLKYNSNFKHFDYVNPKAKKGGAVNLAVQGSFNSLNPFILKGISASGVDFIYDSLMEGSGDEISALYPLIARSVSLAPDNFSVTFLLDKRAKFSDGHKLNADDVIFTFETLINKGHPAYKIAYKDIKKVQKIDDYCVKFHFKTNKNKDLAILIASMKILPKHFYEKNQFDLTVLEKTLGSGPYVIKKTDWGKSIIYERNKNYWAKNLPVNVGRFNFDEIIYNYYLDANVMVEAFKAGEFDFRQENIARNWATIYDIDAVKNGEIIKEEIKHDLPAPVQTFVLNLRRAKFQNIALRKAMTYAFNFEWLKKHIFYGSYERTKSYFANSIFAYGDFDLPVFDENDFGRKNLIIAKNILDDAGYKIIDGKLIDPKTQKPVEIEFLIASKSFEMIVAPFVDNLQKLGIAAKMKYEEENQFQLRLNNYNYDVFVGVFSPSLIPASELLRYWHSSQADIKGAQNYSGLKDTKIDKIIEKIVATKDKKALILLCKKLDKMLLENYYTILQWHSNSHRILYKKSLKRPKIAPKYGLGFDSWWIEGV
jgi:microcin C transport system substrate-binding protein